MWWRCDAQFSKLRHFGVPCTSEYGRFLMPSAFVEW
jgi:hypothetical protein